MKITKLSENLAKTFLCPLNIHIEVGCFDDYECEIDYCKLCGKEKINGKWKHNPY